MNVDAIFDTIIKVAKADAQEYKITEKKKQIASVTAQRCGNCGAWMTSYCKPEKERGQFKSMNSWACGDFGLSSGSLLLRDEFTAELETLEAQLRNSVANFLE